MTIKALNPYVILNGTCGKAIQQYEAMLGAKVEALMRPGDIPGGGNANPDTVVHALVRVGPHAIMFSDAPPDHPVAAGGNVDLALDFEDIGDMTKAFDAMAKGGTVTTPIQDMFWGAKWGALTDTFGVRWMFNCETKKG